MLGGKVGIFLQTASWHDSKCKITRWHEHGQQPTPGLATSIA